MATKLLSPCCEKPAKPNKARAEGEPFYFCTECLKGCEPKQKEGFGAKRSTLSSVCQPTGERALFEELYFECRGKSVVSGMKLLPPDHPMFHAQGCHLLPKGSYQEYRTKRENVIMTTVEEHTEEWPFVKEKTDVELRESLNARWIPYVTRFRALRLAYNQRLTNRIAGK